MNYAVIAAQFFTKNLRWFVIGGVLLAVYFLGKPLWFRIFGQVPTDAPYRRGGGDVTASFASAVSNKIIQIRKGIRDDGWFGSDLRCNTLTEVSAFNDNELTLVHNKYKNKYGITLYDDLTNAAGDGCNDFFGADMTEILKDRLTTLSLV